MIKKNNNYLCGVKGTVQVLEKKGKKKAYKTVDSPDKVDLCLNCTKPAKECKGDCFGKK